MYTPYTYTTPGTNQTINPPASSYVWEVRDANMNILPQTAANTATPGWRITNQGSANVQLEFFNPTNAPMTMVVRLVETIQYVNASLNPTTKACPIADTFVVTVNPIPKPVITSADGGITGPNGLGPCGRYSNTYATTADAGSTFAWTISGGTIVSGVANSTMTATWNDVTSVTAGYVEVMQRFNATQCTTTVRQNLNINVTPTPVVNGPTVVCQSTTNGTNVGTYTVVTKLAGRSYAWNLVNAPAGTTFVVDNLPTGDQITVTWGGNSTSPITAGVRVVETSTTSGCMAENTLNVTLNPNPTPVITSTTNGLNVNGVCSGSTHAYATTNNAGNTYQWSVTGGVINGSATNNSVSVTWGAAGAATITVVEKVGPAAGTGCYTTVTANITVRPLPLPDLTNQTGGFNSTSVCELSTTQYRTVDNTANGNTYVWTVTGGVVSAGAGTPTISVTWGNAGNGTVKVVETTPASQGSCSDSRTLNVAITPLPNPVISGPPAPPVCINTTLTYSTPNVVGNTYLWSATGGLVVGANNTSQVNITWTVAGNGTVSVTETNSATTCSKTVNRTIPVNALPIVTITPSGPTTLCTGQTITLSATDGFASYTWSTGETTPNITTGRAGGYTVTVIDNNGCRSNRDTITITVTPVQKPVITASGPLAFCQGSSVTLTATPSGAAAYRWSNGATTQSINVTTAGRFWVEITYNSTCKAMSDEVEVTVAPVPQVTVAASGVKKFCQGGSVTLSATPGFVTYSWMRGTTAVGTNSATLRVTDAGIYTVTVNNGFCNATSRPDTIVVNPLPTPTIQASGALQFCTGDSVTLDAGGPYAAYLWSPGGQTTRRLVAKEGKAYSVTVTDTNGCTGQSQAVTVVVHPTPPKPTIAKTNNNLVSSTAATYQWIKNNTDIAGATSQQHDAFPTGNGNYQVRITDGNGCVNTSDPIPVTIVGVEPIAGIDGQGVLLFPNPTSGMLTMRIQLDQEASIAQVSVRDLVGSEMLGTTLSGLTNGANTRQLDLTQLPNGVYYIEVVMPNGARFTSRITKVDN